ncbi:MAG: glycosyltransferase, partial [Clostridium sp.]
LSYCFIDDNDNVDSEILLHEFAKTNNVNFLSNNSQACEYHCDETSHRWSEDLINKVIDFKNRMIDYFLSTDNEYIFFIDSDLVLNKDTLTRLVSLNKDIVSNIFWTQWTPDSAPMPQVWLQDNYNFYIQDRCRNLTPEEVNTKSIEFLEMIKKPGTYEVGGLGACTLINRDPLEAGVNFSFISNVSFFGEDRSFCVRAAVLGYTLYVDTYYPAYHIYRESDLTGVNKYIDDSKNRNFEIIATNSFDKIVNYANLVFNGTTLECEFGFTESTNKMIVNVKFYRNENTNGIITYKEFMGKINLDISNPENPTTIDYELLGEIEREIPNISRSVTNKPKITLSMIVKNEEKRYLKQVLESLREIVHDAVFIDDGSNDNTVTLIHSVFSDIPHTVIENKTSKFSNEILLRKQQWNETIKTNPNWILFLDADEMFEKNASQELSSLIANPDIDTISFRLYDMWTETHYRSDNLWCAHNTYRPFLIRYQPEFNYIFKEATHHCGRMPMNVLDLNSGTSQIKIKHLGWIGSTNRTEKYKRYLLNDPVGAYGSIQQYISILDDNPNLEPWVD